MIRFKVPKKLKSKSKEAKVIFILRDYGRERQIPSKEVVYAHKNFRSWPTQ